MRESQLQTKLLKELKKHGWFYKASDRYRAGIPDIIGCYQGSFFGIECKAGKNKPTALQEKNLRDIAKSGGIALVINEDNIDDVMHSLNQIPFGR